MTDKIKLTVGGSLKEDLAAFRQAWEQLNGAKRSRPIASWHSSPGTPSLP
jgi:hypothetical protein